MHTDIHACTFAYICHIHTPCTGSAQDGFVCISVLITEYIGQISIYIYISIIVLEVSKQYGGYSLTSP